MPRPSVRAGTLLAAALLAAAPLVAQSAPPVRQLPPGGTPQHASIVRRPAGDNLAAFMRSFEVSLDGVHWGTSITTSIACRPGNGAPCAPGTRAITIYTRWAPINPPVDMAAAHRQSPTLSEPYHMEIPGASPSVCTVGAPHPQASSGYPVSITPAGQGGSFPIICHWRISGVAIDPAATTSIPQKYLSYPSNTATVTVNWRPAPPR